MGSMDWRRHPSADPADPHGVADLLARACEVASSSAVEGTRFVFTTAEMLRVSREIEQDSMVTGAARLDVGVQLGHRLQAQADVYGMLTDSGVEVRAYCADGDCMDGDSLLPDVKWVHVDDDPLTLEASWFLVREGDAPHALVGFELDRAPGGARRWEGFESRDPLLISAIVAHLDRVASRVGAGSSARR